jgi:hypothetical protein
VFGWRFTVRRPAEFKASVRKVADILAAAAD